MEQIYPEPEQTAEDNTSSTAAAAGALIAVVAIILAFAGPALIIAAWRWAL